MISTTKLQSSVKQVSQVEIAVQNFKTKYKNTTPGDSIIFGGNGDGLVISDTSAGSYPVFDGEFSRFWVELNQSGFDSKRTYTSTLSASGIDFKSFTPNAPAFPLGENSSILYYKHTDIPTIGNYYIGNMTLTGGGINVSESLTAADAHAFDTKVDNGLASTGNIIGFDSTAFEATNTLTANNCRPSGFMSTTYNITKSGVECVLVIRAAYFTDI